MKRWCLRLLVALVVVAHGCTVVEVPGPMGVAAEGDPCGPPGSLACTADGATELVCVDLVFHVSQDCPGGCELAEEADAAALLCADEDGHALGPPADAGY